MNKAITLLDGAVGTSIWEKTEDKLPVWIYNILKPDVVRELADEYVAAGSKIILANTFGANGPSVKRSSDFSVHEIVSTGVRIAKEATAGTDVKVALSIGPLTQMMEPYGDLTEEEVAEIYDEMLKAGMEEKPDLVMLQTFIDLEMLRVAAETAMKYGIPVFATMSFEKVGKTMFGNSVEDVIETLTEVGVSALGMNCSLGPDLALPIIKEFAEKTDLPLIFKPNAGKPILSSDGSTESPYTAAMFAEEIKPALPYVSYIGGCCGSNASYVKAIKKVLE